MNVIKLNSLMKRQILSGEIKTAKYSDDNLHIRNTPEMKLK